MKGSKIHHLQCFAKKNKWAHMQEISEPEYKNLTSLEELEKMKGLPLATSGNAASISSIYDSEHPLE